MGFNALSDSNRAKIEKEIREYLIEIGNSQHNNIESQVAEAINHGLNLVTEILASDPPGRLWVEERGAIFDPARCEDQSGRSKGNIEFTIFPGYSVGSHIYHRAIVFTEAELQKEQTITSSVIQTTTGDDNSKNVVESSQYKIDRLKKSIHDLCEERKSILDSSGSFNKYKDIETLINDLILMLSERSPQSCEQKLEIIKYKEEKAAYLYCQRSLPEALYLFEEVLKEKRHHYEPDHKEIRETTKKIEVIQGEIKVIQENIRHLN